MPAANEASIAHLVDLARVAFGREPAFVVRAPGRVNLLGEHTDYNMLPVLPMAIERRVLIAGAARADSCVTLKSLDRFPERQYELTAKIAPYDAGDWGNYSKAAAQGLTDYYGSPLPHGADLLIGGNIPTGAGLSSSSALVVANALALLAANDRRLAHETLAEILPQAERYVGTLSGGMDQAISLLAQDGNALRIDFAPLRWRPVPLSPDYAIVVCDSLVRAEKSGAAKHGYNQRVIECRLACRVLEAALGSAARLAALGDLVRLFPQRSLPSFVDDLSRILPDRPLDLEDIALAAGISTSELHRACSIPSDMKGPFQVLRRARHVLHEAERVDQAERALRGGDVIEFGRLMDASHRSCRDDYEISCPELEILVRLAKESGAVGARLTGAGFGGCTVSLLASPDVNRFLTNVDDTFYRQVLKPGQSPDAFRFVFSPQPGAQTMALSEIRG